MAVGPTLCSGLVQATGTPVAAIVFVLAIHLFILALYLFVVPESLSEVRRSENKRSRQEANERARGQNIPSDVSLQTRLSAFARKAFAFLGLLSIVGPIETTTGSGRKHKDYSLTFIALSSGLASMILASNPTLFQFAFKTYSWTAVRVRYGIADNRS